MEKEKRTKKWRYGGGKGTISIFLVIILVPCIIFTCMFGDISRVQLSKAQAVGAGDLALYALLANYDEDLKENYGLVASAKMTDNDFNKAASYFNGMMNADSVSGSNNGMLTSYLHDALTGDASNFLQVELTEPAKVSNLDNNTLKNPALLEDSIVEFMKYRGPYEMIEGFLKRLGALNLTDTLKDADKDAPIKDARTEYAKAEGELIKKLYYSYLAIRCYVDSYEQKQIPSLEKYMVYEQKLKKAANDFAKVTDLITKYYAAADGIRQVSFPVYRLDAYQNLSEYRRENLGIKITGTVEPEFGDGDDSQIIFDSEPATEEKYCIDKALLEKLLKYVNQYIQDVKNAAANITNSCAGMADRPDNGDMNWVIYCLRMQNAASSDNLRILAERGEYLMRTYAKLQTALTLEEKPTENDLPYDWKDQIWSAMEKIKEVQKDYFQPGASSEYGRLVSRYQSVAAGVINNVQNRSYTFYSEYLDSEVRIEEFVLQVKQDFSVIDTEISDQINRLNIVIKGGTFSYDGKVYNCISLDELKKSVLDYSAKRREWGRTIAASGSNSDYAQKEKAAYNGESDDDSEKMAKALAEDNGRLVDELKKRLTNICKDMENYQASLNNFTYGGRKAVDLGGTDDAISAARTKIPTDYKKIDLSLAENSRQAQDYHKALLKPSSGDVYKAPVLKAGETGNDPDLNTDCELYRILRNQFQSRQEEIDSAVDDNNAKIEEYKKEAEKQKNDALGVSSTYLKGKGGDLGFTPSSSSSVTPISSILGFAEAIGHLFNGDFDTFRDQFYVAEYIMDMFSYSSFNNEGQYRLPKTPKAEKAETLKDFLENGGTYGVSYEKTWNTDDKANLMENQSLTNWHINSEHNQMNLGEVEYILYGSSSIDANLEDAYRSIYFIREILNVLSGFQNFFFPSGDISSTSGVLDVVANFIMGATCGVIPSALTKCIVIPILATFETSHDLLRLKAGFPVSLYKTAEDDWYYGLVRSGNSGFSFDGKKDPEDENGLFYSDYMYFFVMCGVFNSNTYRAMLFRIGDLIQANMRKMGAENFDLGEAKCFFKLEATLKVKPLLIDLPIVNSSSGVDTGELKNSDSWCTYKLSLVRGYS